MFNAYNLWEEIDINWEIADFTWNEILIISEISGGSPEDQWNKYNNLSKKNKKIIINLICKIKDKEYSQKKIKNNKNYKVTIKDINIIVEKVNNILITKI